MFERERRLFTFNLGFVERLTADVSDEEFGNQPAPGMNPPRWILAHLAIGTDFCLRLLGKEPALSPEWQKAFGPGSKANADDAPRLSKSELLSVLREGHERVLAALESVDESLLGQPHGVRFESLEKFFPTRGELLAQMMTNHAAFHIGQLSAWRRASGRAPLF